MSDLTTPAASSPLASSCVAAANFFPFPALGLSDICYPAAHVPQGPGEQAQHSHPGHRSLALRVPAWHHPGADWQRGHPHPVAVSIIHPILHRGNASSNCHRVLCAVVPRARSSSVAARSSSYVVCSTCPVGVPDDARDQDEVDDSRKTLQFVQLPPRQATYR